MAAANLTARSVATADEKDQQQDRDRYAEKPEQDIAQLARCVIETDDRGVSRKVGFHEMDFCTRHASA
jgi:hypothetical protein